MMSNVSKVLNDDGARCHAISLHVRSILVEAGAGCHRRQYPGKPGSSLCHPPRQWLRDNPQIQRNSEGYQHKDSHAAGGRSHSVRAQGTDRRSTRPGCRPVDECFADRHRHAGSFRARRAAPGGFCLLDRRHSFARRTDCGR